jgi:hypothetical protein
MIRFYRNAIETAWADHRAGRALVWECVALRHQLAVLRRSGTRRRRFRPIDRPFWVFISWWWPAWREALKVVQPETVLRWRRGGTPESGFLLHPNTTCNGLGFDNGLLIN